MIHSLRFRNVLLVLVVAVLTFINTRVFFHTGFPYTHDGENHLARFANYKIAIREGQFPPRFAPNLMNHYGYPVFNYNYPLANILSLPFSFLKINYEITFRILVAAFLIFGFWGVNKWLESLGFKHKSKLFGISVFTLSPYLLSTIVFRGNIGEIMAMMLLPYLFYLVEQIKNNKLKIKSLGFLMAILLTSMFMLSHNVTVLFGISLLFLYAAIRFAKNINFWKIFLLFNFYSLGLTLWFWLPAIIEKNQIILDDASLSKGFADHFPTLRQLIFSPLEFGFSQLGSIDSFGYSLGFLQLIILLLSPILMIKLINKKRFKKNYLYFTFYFLIFFLTLFQLKFTQAIWLKLPLVNFIQFPWRLSLLITVLIAPLAAFIFKITNNKLRFCLLLIALIQANYFVKIRAVDYFHKNNIDYDAFSQSSTTANENLPKNFKYKQIDWQPGPKIISGEGEVNVEYWKGSDRKYQLSLNKESIIVEPTMYYLGWETYTKNNDQNKIKVNYLDNDEIQGRIAYFLPAGSYEIRSKFTQNTWARIAGNSISIFSFLGIVVYYLYGKTRT